MNIPRPTLAVRTVAAGLLAAAAGCNIVPEPQADPTRYYILSASETNGTPQANAPAVYLREVDLASYLRSRPLIVRRGENEIEFREFSRWGEPLELGIARVLREELVSRGAAGAVRVSAVRRETVAHDHVLTVRVLACEGRSDGEVIFRAKWELTSTARDAAEPVRGDYRPANLRWDGKTEASLAAQLSQAVVGLAGEIAGALARR